MTEPQHAGEAQGNGSQRWPADEVVRRAVDDLVPYARNSRTHDKEQVAQIAASMREWGFTNPILIDPEGNVIAGHGRLMAAKQLGLEEVPCVVARGWTEAQRRAYVIADNKLALNAGWDEDMLKVEFQELEGLGFDLGLTGWQDYELEDLFSDPDEDEEPGGEGGSDGEDRGELLKRVDVTIDDPKHEVHKGEQYVIRGKHYLFISPVIDGWQDWVGKLTGKSLFVPYPSPLAVFSTRGDEYALVMVQPDLYMAGHILDRVAECWGEDAIEKVLPDA